MVKFLRAGIFLCGILLSALCQGQDVPLGTLPMYYNSSFAGEGGVPRFNSTLRHSKFKMNDFTTLDFQNSFDVFIPAIRSGIGFTSGVTQNGFFSHNFKGYNLGFAIAPKFSLGGKVTISPSLDYMLFNGASADRPFKGYNSNVGILLNTSKFFMGYSAILFKSVNMKYAHTDAQTFKDNIADSHLGKFQIGYTFQRNPDSKFSVTPHMMFRIGSENHIRGFYLGGTKLLVNFRYDNILWGISDDGLHLGWQKNNLRLMVFNNVLGYFLPEIIHNTSFFNFRYQIKNK